MKIRFYDNAEYNFVGMDPIIECILVTDKEPHSLVKKDFKPYLDIIDSIKEELPDFLAEKYFIRYREKFPNVSSVFETNPHYMPSPGMTISQINELIRWILRHRDEQKIVFLDWDRTITCLEGIKSFETAPISMLRDYLVYLCGGPQRMAKLLKLFQVMRDYEVDYYILTNNTMAASHLDLFFRYLTILDPFATPEKIIASYGNPSKSATLQKMLSRWRAIKVPNIRTLPSSQSLQKQLTQQQQKQLKQQQKQMKQLQALKQFPIDNFPFTVKYNSRTISCILPLSKTIGDLKESLGPIFSIPPENINLIYQGNILRDNSILGSIKNIHPGMTIILISWTSAKKRQP